MLFWLQMYYNCECVTAAVEAVAVTGRCDGHCNLLSMFLVIFALIIFVTFTTSMPALAATLRYILLISQKFGRYVVGNVYLVTAWFLWLLTIRYVNS